MAYMTDTQRKEEIVHSCDWFTFTSCADLSIGIKVTQDTSLPVSPDKLAGDVAQFTCWWMIHFHSKLNGFSGIDTIKWDISKVKLAA